jgi:hypothetical protein
MDSLELIELSRSLVDLHCIVSFLCLSSLVVLDLFSFIQLIHHLFQKEEANGPGLASNTLLSPALQLLSFLSIHRILTSISQTSPPPSFIPAIEPHSKSSAFRRFRPPAEAWRFRRPSPLKSRQSCGGTLVKDSNQR